MGTEGRKCNRLSSLQKRKLQDWILARWGMIAADKPLIGAVADIACASLGFMVTEANIRSAVMAVGLEWHKGPPRVKRLKKALPTTEAGEASEV